MSRAGTTVGAFLTAIVLAATAIAVTAQDPEPPSDDQEAASLAAVIRQGTCDQPDDIVALLEDVRPRTAEEATSAEDAGAGAAARQSVRYGITEVPMALSGMVDGQHALVIEDPQTGQAVACGAVAGAVVDDGLAISLPAVEDSGVTGIGWLVGLGLEATRVHVFVTHPDDATGTTEPEDDPSPSPTPAAGGDGEQPDPEPDPAQPEPDIDPRDDIDVDV